MEVNANGKVCGVKMARTEMGQPDAKGRRRARSSPALSTWCRLTP
nr:Glutamate synthase [NADPH] small chain [Klebsiella pneumoniae]